MKNCEEKGIYLRAINGYTDHLHCLLSLRNDQTIAKVSQLLKGESSFWINKSNLMPDNFSWQDDYFAVSVSESQVEKVADYIKNQEKHHTKTSFAKEVDQFISRYGWKVIKK